MKNMVDDILYTNYDDLKNVKLIMNKRFGLVVYKDGVKYEFLLKLMDNSDKLIVLGSGALGRNNSKFDRTKPIFSRWSWTLPESMINYNDPTLYIDDDIVAPWCVGTDKKWFLKDISLIIKIISEKLNVSNDKIIFSGSSAGGFSSLLLSTMIKNSIAFVEIPQFDITKWRDYFGDIQKYCFKNKSKSEIIENYGYRLSFIQLMIKEKYIPNAYIYMDCSSTYDFNNQYLPFFNDLNKLKYDDDFNKLKLIIYGQNKGHDHFPIEVYKKILDNILHDIDFKTNNEILLSPLEITLGTSKMIIPKDFRIIESNDSLIVLNDGITNITLFLFSNTSVNKVLGDYLKTNEHYTIKTKHLKSLNNHLVRTSLYVGNSIYINYWFEKNGNTYQYHLINIDNSVLPKIDNSISILINKIE